MSTIKISELADGTITLDSFLALANSSGVAFKGTVDELQTFVNTISVLGLKVAVSASDSAPTEDGLYPCEDTGTYTNFGGLAVNVSNTITFISVSGTQTVFKKVEIPIIITIDATPTEGSVNAVQSGGVYNKYKYNSLIDVSNSTSASVVNYDTTTAVLTIYDDTILWINDGNSIKSISGTRTVDCSTISSSLIKVAYNFDTDIFTPYLYNATLLPSQRVFCYLRKSQPELTIKCSYSIDGIEVNKQVKLNKEGIEVLESKGNVSLIPSLNGDLPTIIGDVLDLGSDPILLSGNSRWALSLSHPSNPEKYREIDINTAGSSAGRLWFNTDTQEFRTLAWTVQPALNEVLIGGIRKLSSGVNIFNFPFKVITASDSILDVENVLINPSQYYIAHRGVTMGYAPENSLDAYKLAGRMGFSLGECDISKTSDSEYVLMHDDSINRTCKLKAGYTTIPTTVNVGDKTLAELKADYVLASSEVRFRQPIPTLEEFLLTCRKHGVKPMIEIKGTGMFTADVLAMEVLATSILGSDGYVFTSFSNSLLDSIRVVTADVRLYYISETNPVTLKAKGNAGGYYNYTSLTDTIVKSFKNEGVEIGAWTVPNNKFNNLLNLGVNFVATDTIASEVSGTPLFADYSDGTYDSYATTGTITDGIIELLNTESIVLNTIIDTVKLGAYYLNIDFEGVINIVATNLTDSSVTNLTYDNYTAKSMLYNEGFSLTITAGSGGAKIKDIILEITQY